MNTKIYFVLAFIILIAGCGPDKIQEHKLAGDALGTTYHITYLGEEIPELNLKVDSIIEAINSALSTYQKNSFITHFNENSLGKWREKIGLKAYRNNLTHFSHMLNLSKDISLATNGAFDPSAALLFGEYLKAKENNTYLRDSVVKKCLASQGLKKVETHSDVVKLDSNVRLNFNAIAKGYLVDVIADYIADSGCASLMVEVGGEMRVIGRNKVNEPWRIGINKPEAGASTSAIFKVLELENTAIATSGNYQNFYYVNDSLIGHTLDPRTGKPVIHNLKSVSIMSNQCAVSDAYATACMVLGYEKSKSMIQKDSTLSAFLIVQENGELRGEYIN